MAYYSLAMLELARELAEQDPVYEDMVVKFLEHFVLIMEAMEASGLLRRGRRLLLRPAHRRPTGNATPIRVADAGRGASRRCRPSSIPIDRRASGAARLGKRFARRLEQRSTSAEGRDWRSAATGDSRRLLLSVVPPEQLRRMLDELFDEDAFLSPHGLRSLSKRHSDAVPRCRASRARRIEYEPAESRTAHVRRQLQLAGPGVVADQLPGHPGLAAVRPVLRRRLHGRVPDRLGRQLSLRDVAEDLADRLVSIWLPDGDGRRPVYGGVEQFQTDPAWQDNLLFFEYFHGDNGAGLGASHQTGWTALVVDLIIDPPGVRPGDHP